MIKHFHIFILVFFLLASARADLTNTVYIITNVFTQVFSQHVITQKIKSSHTEYYFTNFVTTINKHITLSFRTNLSVNCDLSDAFARAAVIAEAMAAEFGEGGTRSVASASASSATISQGAQSMALSASMDAQLQRTLAAAECATAISNINARINWFDQHAGETITQYNITSNFIIHVNAQDYTFAYTNVSGQSVYTNVAIHPYDVNGGATVTASKTNYYAMIDIQIYPLNRDSSSDYWYFKPAYMDSDAAGMRIQYVPYNKNHIALSGGKLVPRWFYWQDGCFYLCVRWWYNGSVGAWFEAKCISDNFYPLASFNPMSYVNSDGYGYTSSSKPAYMKAYTTTAKKGGSFNVPLNVSPADSVIVEWMQNGPVLSDLYQQVTNLESRVNALEN